MVRVAWLAVLSVAVASGLGAAPARRAAPRLQRTSVACRGGASPAEWYVGELEAHPARTRMWSSGAIGAGGDALAQVLGGAPFDAARLAAFALVNAFYIAPVVGPWFGFLARRAEAARESTDLPGWAVTGAQTVVDQTVGAVGVLAGFFVALEVCKWTVGVASGKLASPGPAVAAGRAAAVKTLWPTLRANWKIWPAANYVNFLLVPPKFQLLFSNAVAFFWSAVLSALAN